MQNRFIKDDLEASQIIEKVILYAFKLGLEDFEEYKKILDLCRGASDLMILGALENRIKGTPSYWGHYDVTK